MKPKDVLWTLEPHSEGKHQVLRHYLNAWFPILGSFARRLLFIDGFAGPGEYAGGQPGSPIIALDTFLTHGFAPKLANVEVVFLFIEDRADRADHLRGLVAQRRARLPGKWAVEVLTGKFDDHLTTALDELDRVGKQLAPAFVMIDPFGVSGTPMSVVSRIMRNDRAEVYISLMYEAVNRHAAAPEFASHLDDLFGTAEWRGGLVLDDPDSRKEFYYALYERQLRAAGAQHVVKFELYEGARHVYSVFFGTKSWKGADRMKQAIWKVAPFGDFAFRGSRNLALGLKSCDEKPLQDAVVEEFTGRGWITIEQVLEFVSSDKTDYHTGQVKKHALAPLENGARIEVDPTTRKRKGSYPEGTRLRVAL